MKATPELPPHTYPDAADLVRNCLNPNYASRPSVFRLRDFPFLIRPPDRATAIAATFVEVNGGVGISGIVGGAPGSAAKAVGEDSGSSDGSALPSTSTDYPRLDAGGPSRGSSESAVASRPSRLARQLSRSDSFGQFELSASSGSGSGSRATGGANGRAGVGVFVGCLRRAWAMLEGGRLYVEDLDMEAAFLVGWAPTVGRRRLLGTGLLAMVRRGWVRV